VLSSPYDYSLTVVVSTSVIAFTVQRGVTVSILFDTAAPSAVSRYLAAKCRNIHCNSGGGDTPNGRKRSNSLPTAPGIDSHGNHFMLLKLWYAVEYFGFDESGFQGRRLL
jgi:hypothetical protein